MFRSGRVLSNHPNLSKSTVRSFGSTPEGPLKKTALNALHFELGAKMVPFCGWEMPLQYPDGILTSHLHCRTKASLFDVSHMAQLHWTGKDRVKFLEHLVVADLGALPKQHAKLSVIMNEKGGIIDDTVITNRGDFIYMVVNAGCADKDLAHFKKQLEIYNKKGYDVKMEHINRSLLALQGPSAEGILSRLVKEDITKMPFMTAQEMVVDGLNCLVSRCGYTGEDGFEISVENTQAVKLAKKLLSFEEVKPAGLGPRYSLRLEAGLCLYGNDLNEDISPIEAGLAWTIGARRKTEGGFLGSDIVLKQLKEGVKKKRVGLFVTGPPAREHTPLLDKGKQVGEVTSGTFSPILKKGVAMAYLPTELSKIGTEVSVNVRGKTSPAVVTKMPFVPTNYKRVD